MPLIETIRREPPPVPAEMLVPVVKGLIGIIERQQQEPEREGPNPELMGLMGGVRPPDEMRAHCPFCGK
jgi:hypothetical protein